MRAVAARRSQRRRCNERRPRRRTAGRKQHGSASRTRWLRTRLRVVEVSRNTRGRWSARLLFPRCPARPVRASRRVHGGTHARTHAFVHGGRSRRTHASRPRSVACPRPPVSCGQDTCRASRVEHPGFTVAEDTNGRNYRASQAERPGIRPTTNLKFPPEGWRVGGPFDYDSKFLLFAGTF